MPAKSSQTLVSLFLYYNDLYFDGTLLHCIVQWSSPRMTL